MRIALYARVSTRQQDRSQTIDSQLTALKNWAKDNGHVLRAESVYTDPGSSGSRLDRPGLDRLRDAIVEGGYDILAVYSPDRLARRYIHQTVLLEEFRKNACEVVFVHRPISSDPHDQLLLQIQGAVAEYERSVITERFRRGKLQRARAGHWVAGRAPYGYRYVPKRDGVPGFLVVDPTEAEMIRTLFRWLTEEHVSLRTLAQRLADSPWRPRCGRTMWSPTVIRRILADPMYAGVGYANRYTQVPSPHPHRRARRPEARTCRREKPRDEWIPIPVPAIIDQTVHEQAVAQLAQNGARSRRNTKHFYLLRCLLSCGHCGRAIVGVSHTGRCRREQPHRYYKCTGNDAVCPKYQKRCPRRWLVAEVLEAAVWDYTQRLLRDPHTLRMQFEAWNDAHDHRAANRSEVGNWDAQLRRLDREDRRLVDAYQAEAIGLTELKERREKLRERRAELTVQREASRASQASRESSEAAWRDWMAFCDRIRGRLSDLSPAEQQRVLQLSVERIIVNEGSLEVRHVIPLNALPVAANAMAPVAGSDAAGASTDRSRVRLCSDRVCLSVLRTAEPRPADRQSSPAARADPEERHRGRPARPRHRLEDRRSPAAASPGVDPGPPRLGRAAFDPLRPPSEVRPTADAAL